MKPGVLNSWKEIAAYLRRGLRTVQRWESELDLPIRRPLGRRRGPVMAFPEELDEWLRRGSLGAEIRRNTDLGASVDLEQSCRELAKELMLLQQRLARRLGDGNGAGTAKLVKEIRETVRQWIEVIDASKKSKAGADFLVSSLNGTRNVAKFDKSDR